MMILIGQYDSPFVRRVGIALQLYDLKFEHRPWSVFGDADKIRALNPLVRVPTLVLDDGFVLTDSHMILDYLDNLMPPAQRMFPQTEPARHIALKLTTLATGLAEKAVSLFYETRLHRTVSDVWVGRCQSQITGLLDALEADRNIRPAPYWFGPDICHTDIAVTCALRFLTDVHPQLFSPITYPALSKHTRALESLVVFQDIQQPFAPPA